MFIASKLALEIFGFTSIGFGIAHHERLDEEALHRHHWMECTVENAESCNRVLAVYQFSTTVREVAKPH